MNFFFTRDNKFTVKLSDNVIDYLLRYLKGSNHLILLQILNLYIEVKGKFICEKFVKNSVL